MENLRARLFASLIRKLMLLFMLHFCVQIYHEINIEFYVHKFGLTVHTELTNSIVVQSTVN